MHRIDRLPAHFLGPPLRWASIKTTLRKMSRGTARPTHEYPSKFATGNLIISIAALLASIATQNYNMSASDFRVIVVGGGPVGLTAAHALTQAGIRFTILESRPSVVIDAGSNLVLLPMGMRLLGQLGLMKALDAVSSPLGKVQRYNHQGRHMGDSRTFIHMKEKSVVAPTGLRPSS